MKKALSSSWPAANYITAAIVSSAISATTH
jgi:hypothetical protein